MTIESALCNFLLVISRNQAWSSRDWVLASRRLETQFSKSWSWGLKSWSWSRD